MPSLTDFSDLLAAKSELSRQLLASDLSVVRARAARHVAAPSLRVNLQGIGVGFKTVGGRITAEPAVKFYVRSKQAKSLIDANDALPETVDGLPTDVEEIGFLQPLTNPRARMRPARPGCSTGPSDADPLNSLAGTLGALVEDPAGRYILSNNHVLADQNRQPFGTTIFEPSPFDTGDPARDAIAELEGYVPLDTAGPNYVDAAIARLLDDALAVPDILVVGAPTGTAPATLSSIVEKFGRTTGYTKGFVDSISTDLKVPYEIGTILFHDQIAIKSMDSFPFSEQGDSGSLVLEEATGRGVALLFAGSPSISFGNHIADVLASFQVELVTG